MNRWLVQFVLFVSFVLPLTFAPGLEDTFSTPKLVLLGFVLALGLPPALILRGTTLRLPFPFEAILFLWLVSLSASSILGTVASIDTLLIQLFGVGWLVLLVLVQPPAEALAGAIILSGAGISLVALLQYLGMDPFALAGWMPLGLGSRRMQVYATLGSPNFVAAFLTSLVPVTIGVSCKVRPSNNRLAVLAILGLQLLAIAATGSRAPILGLLAGAVCWVLLNPTRMTWKAWAAILCGCLTLVALSPARSLKTTLEGRIYLWKITAQHIRDAPVFGLGPGAFEAFFPQWETDWWHQGRSPGIVAGMEDHAHNDFLEIWIEQGILGFLTFAGVVAVFFLRARQTLLENQDLIAGSAAGVTAMLAVALVDFPFHRLEECFLFWTLVGLIPLRPQTGLSPAQTIPHVGTAGEQAALRQNRVKGEHP